MNALYGRVFMHFLFPAFAHFLTQKGLTPAWESALGFIVDTSFLFYAEVKAEDVLLEELTAETILPEEHVLAWFYSLRE